MRVAIGYTANKRLSVTVSNGTEEVVIELPPIPAESDKLSAPKQLVTLR